MSISFVGLLLCSLIRSIPRGVQATSAVDLDLQPTHANTIARWQANRDSVISHLKYFGLSHLNQDSATSTVKMPVPAYGAAPLAKTFVMVRSLSLIAMVSIIGLTANFVSEIVATNIEPPKEIVGTLVVVSPSQRSSSDRVPRIHSEVAR